MKHFTKQNNFLYSLTEKFGIQMNSTVYTLKENNKLFSKIYSATKHSSPPNVYFYGIFSQCLIEYSFIKIVEFEFTLKIKI